VPILAELAEVVATGRAGAKDGRSGPHVKGRLLFDGVYLQGAGVAVDHGVVAAAGVGLVAAEAPPPFGDSASPEAHLTVHPVAIQLEIVSRFVECRDGSALGGGRWGASAVKVGLWVGVNIGRVGDSSGVKVGGGATVPVGSTGVISARRCGPAQDTSLAPSAARNPFWRNFLLVSFPLMGPPTSLRAFPRRNSAALAPMIT
jgi:hypothetical protein